MGTNPSLWAHCRHFRAIAIKICENASISLPGSTLHLQTTQTVTMKQYVHLGSITGGGCTWWPALRLQAYQGGLCHMQAVWENLSLTKGLDRGEMGHLLPGADYTRRENMWRHVQIVNLQVGVVGFVRYGRTDRQTDRQADRNFTSYSRSVNWAICALIESARSACALPDGLWDAPHSIFAKYQDGALSRRVPAVSVRKLNELEQFLKQIKWSV